MAGKIEFSRGDDIHHQFSMPADSWTAGGELFFAAKPAIDDDTTDANAEINQSWDDTAVSDTTIDGVAYKQYDCYFPPSATSSIPSNGADSAEYLAEFQFVASDGTVMTFPPNDPKLQCIVYFDVKRKTTV